MNSPLLTFSISFFFYFFASLIYSQPTIHDSLKLNSQIQIATDTSKVTNTNEKNLIGFAESQIDNSINNNLSYFYEPFPLKKGSYVFQLGASFSLLPIPIAEQEIPVPAIDVQFKYALSQNLCFVASLSSSLHYSDLLHSGIQWNVNTDRLSLGLASHFGVAYGYINDNINFDQVWAMGFFGMPILRFGYRFDHFSLTLSFVTTYAFATHSEVHNTPGTLGSEKKFNDFFCTVSLEQPFLKNQLVVVGFSFAYARTPYQSWMLYNTVNEWLFVPEFFFAVQL